LTDTKLLGNVGRWSFNNPQFQIHLHWFWLVNIIESLCAYFK